MTLMKSLATVALLTLAATASAHTQLKEAVPANGSTVKTSPEHIMLTFSESIRVTALSLQNEARSEQSLRPLPSSATDHVMVPAPKLAPGRYTVNWRGLGKDNHIISGKIQFTVGRSD